MLSGQGSPSEDEYVQQYGEGPVKKLDRKVYAYDFRPGSTVEVELDRHLVVVKVRFDGPWDTDSDQRWPSVHLIFPCDVFDSLAESLTRLKGGQIGEHPGR